MADITMGKAGKGGPYPSNLPVINVDLDNDKLGESLVQLKIKGEIKVKIHIVDWAVSEIEEM